MKISLVQSQLLLPKEQGLISFEVRGSILYKDHSKKVAVAVRWEAVSSGSRILFLGGLFQRSMVICHVLPSGSPPVMLNEGHRQGALGQGVGKA